MTSLHHVTVDQFHAFPVRVHSCTFHGVHKRFERRIVRVFGDFQLYAVGGGVVHVLLRSTIGEDAVTQSVTGGPLVFEVNHACLGGDFDDVSFLCHNVLLTWIYSNLLGLTRTRRVVIVCCWLFGMC